MTEGRIIYNPSASVMKMFYRKMNAESREELKSRKFDACLLYTSESGSHLLFHAVSSIVPSAAQVLTCLLYTSRCV